MKKKMIKVMMIVIPLFLAVLGAWYYCSLHLNAGPAFPFMHHQETSGEPLTGGLNAPGAPVNQIADDQLFSPAETKEEASRIADMYGITLVNYQEGVATYHTEEDPQTVIQRGKDSGYPELYLNIIRTIN